VLEGRATRQNARTRELFNFRRSIWRICLLGRIWVWGELSGDKWGYVRLGSFCWWPRATWVVFLEPWASVTSSWILTSTKLAIILKCFSKNCRFLYILPVKVAPSLQKSSHPQNRPFSMIPVSNEATCQKFSKLAKQFFRNRTANFYPSPRKSLFLRFYVTYLGFI